MSMKNMKKTIHICALTKQVKKLFMYGSFMPLFICMFCLTGCLEGKYDSSLSIGEQIKTRHYDASGESFGKEDLIDEIIESAQKNDIDRMKELFSDYAVKQNDNLDNEIDQFNKVFPQVNELKNRCCSLTGGHNRGSTVYENIYQPMVDIVDSKGETFFLICVWIEGDSEHPEKQGIHSIQLISKEMYDRDKFDIHSKDDKPGCYYYVSE